jgi:hypothetical protein
VEDRPRAKAPFRMLPVFTGLKRLLKKSKEAQKLSLGG